MKLSHSSFYLQIRGMLHGKGMQFAFASTKIARMGLVGTDLEPLLRLHVGRTCYLCCEQAEVAKLLKLLKKMPTYVLLGKFRLFFFFYFLTLF